ncbi:MAG: beta-xylosidase [Terracidiphilus sp.]|jgi:xylan 1,4-beta-xylosidase
MKKTFTRSGSALLALILPAATSLFAQTPAPPPAPVTIQVHAAQPTGAYTPIWNFYGADEPNFLYAPNGKKLLGELAALSPVPVYFRPHNLFTTGNGDGSLKWGSTNVYTEKPDGTPVYDFTITDRIFDALVAAHIRPIVEIGFMPQALSTHPEPYRHTFPKGEIWTGWTYPPKDEAKWSKLVLAYASHLRDRYGSQTATWLWEVWNEPDIPYWHGTPAEYDRLYDFTAAAIRQALPNAKIGGPEATGVSDHSEPFLRQFLEHCSHGVNAATGEKGAPLDFISYHPKGSPKFVDGHVVMSVGTQLRAVERGMKVITSYPEWKHIPIVLGESDPEGCAACQGSQNGYRNGPLYGVSVAEATMRTYELARKYGVTVEGAVTWAFEFEDQPAFAGFRSLATDGIDKPVLNVFRMMGMLGGGHIVWEEGRNHMSNATWLASESSGALPLDDIVAHSVAADPDVNVVATRNGYVVDVLVWNYHDADVPAEAAPVSITVDGLSGSEVFVNEFLMDAAHSNAYTAWQQMGSPAHPTAEQIEQLQKEGGLEEVTPNPHTSVSDGKVNLAVTLPRQGVMLIRLRMQRHRV